MKKFLEQNHVTFNWRNYTKPTPKNLKLFMEFWKGAIVLITTLSVWEEAPKGYVIAIAILGYVVDRAAKFFATIEAEQLKTTVNVEYPSAIADQVKITTTEEVVPPKSEQEPD